MFYLSALANDKSLKKQIVDTNIQISNWIDKYAESLDLYLSGKRFTRQVNKSRATVSQQVVWAEGGEISTKTNFDLNLKLPNMEKKYKLIFSNYNKSEKYKSSFSRKFADGPAQDDDDYGAAIGFFREIGKVKTTFQPRVKLKDPLETNYILEFEQNKTTKSFSRTQTFQLFADSEKGTGEFFSFDYTKPIAPGWTGTLLLEEEYQDFLNLFTTSSGLGFNQLLSQNMGMSYSMSFYLISRPSYHLDTIKVGPAFSHRLWKNVLHYTVIFTQSFKKDNNFKGESSLAFIVDAIF